jgi:hypothetical protein
MLYESVVVVRVAVADLNWLKLTASALKERLKTLRCWLLGRIIQHNSMYPTTLRTFLSFVEPEYRDLALGACCGLHESSAGAVDHFIDGHLTGVPCFFLESNPSSRPKSELSILGI